MKILMVIKLALVTFGYACGAMVSAQNLDSGRIQGEAEPCQHTKAMYKFCPGSNFPYHWNWTITRDATVADYGTQDNCYLAEVSVGKKSTLLTFNQSNPPGVPQVHNVTKQITPRACAADRKK